MCRGGAYVAGSRSDVAARVVADREGIRSGRTGQPMQIVIEEVLGQALPRILPLREVAGRIPRVVQILDRTAGA